LLLLLVVVAPAQVRLHDQANEDLAKKTRDAFAEFSKADDNVFETMISNTLAIKAATLDHLFELNRQSQQATINVIPVKTWQELQETVDQTHKDYLLAYNSTRKILDPKSGAQSLPDIKRALAAAKARANELAQAQAEKEAELNVKAPKLEDLKKSLEGVRDAVAASAKPVKKLSDLAAFRNLKTAFEGIQEAKGWVEALEKASNAPGLQLLILDLGVRHQQFEVERLKLDIEEAEADKALAERIARRLETVWGDGTFDEQDTKKRPTRGLFGQVYAKIQPCPPGAADCAGRILTADMLSQQVLQTVGVLANAAQGEVGKPLQATQQLRDLLDVLARYVSLVGYHKYLLLADTIEAGTNKHLFSIRRSALNTRDREMLVGHGLEGLATYHAGGLKPEEIANFFRAAQSIATGVLAGRGR
jgi:thioesterase domain-containing protein